MKQNKQKTVQKSIDRRLLLLLLSLIIPEIKLTEEE